MWSNKCISGVRIAALALGVLAGTAQHSIAAESGAPPAPTQLAVATLADQLVLSWKAVVLNPDVVEFKIYRVDYNTCVSNGQMVCPAWFSRETLLGSVAGNPPATTYSLPTPGVPYRFDLAVAACTVSQCSERAVLKVASGTNPIGRPELEVVTSGNGYGAVSSAPAGIDCYVPRPGVNYFVGPRCTQSVSVAQTTILTASAEADSTFIGWSGACSGSSSVCELAVVPFTHQSAQARFMRTVDLSDCLFNWVETNHPAHAAPRGGAVQSTPDYHFKHYAETGSYLGVSIADRHVYYLTASGLMHSLGSAASAALTASCSAR